MRYVLASVCFLALLGSTYAQDCTPPESKEPPRALSAPDDALFQRLKEHIRHEAEDVTDKKLSKHFESLAKDIEDYDPENPKKGFIIAGSMIAAAIGALVAKLIKLMIIKMVLAWIVAHWYYFAIAFVVWLVFTRWVAQSAARGEVRRVK